MDDGSKVRSWRAVKLNDTGFISCGTDGDYNTIGTFFKSFSNVVVSDMASANEDLGDITDKLNMLIAIVKAMNVQKLF